MDLLELGKEFGRIVLGQKEVIYRCSNPAQSVKKKSRTPELRSTYSIRSHSANF